MRTAKLLAVVCFTCTLSSCGHTGSTDSKFANLSNIVSTTTELCGFVIDNGNLVSRPSRQYGVSLLELGPLSPDYRGPVCLEGVVEYVGCVSGPQMCLGWSYDYGLRVTGVRSYYAPNGVSQA
jgi:hypothetical protein